MAKKAVKFPEPGELVVCTATNVKKFGAFVTLDEYESREGFIHVTEVTTGWVKYIRNYVREGQKIVCKVVRVDEERAHIDLSLKAVNDHQRRDKIRAWKNEKKAEKLLEFVDEAIGKEKGWTLGEVGDNIIDSYGSIYAAFEASAIDDGSLKNEGFSGDWTVPFIKIAKENITPPFVSIKGQLDLTNPLPDGAAHLREALLSGEKEEKDLKVTTHYVGAPRYEIWVQAPDYKIAEEELKEAADKIIETMKGRGGAGEFQRKRE